LVREDTCRPLRVIPPPLQSLRNLRRRNTFEEANVQTTRQSNITKSVLSDPNQSHGQSSFNRKSNFQNINQNRNLCKNQSPLRLPPIHSLPINHRSYLPKIPLSRAGRAYDSNFLSFHLQRFTFVHPHTGLELSEGFAGPRLEQHHRTT
jgi:hypothetical protein